MYKSPHALAKFMEVRIHGDSHELNYALISLEMRPSGVKSRNTKRVKRSHATWRPEKVYSQRIRTSSTRNKEEEGTLPSSKFQKENHQSIITPTKRLQRRKLFQVGRYKNFQSSIRFKQKQPGTVT